MQKVVKSGLPGFRDRVVKKAEYGGCHFRCRLCLFRRWCVVVPVPDPAVFLCCSAFQGLARLVPGASPLALLSAPSHWSCNKVGRSGGALSQYYPGRGGGLQSSVCRPAAQRRLSSGYNRSTTGSSRQLQFPVDRAVLVKPERLDYIQNMIGQEVPQEEPVGFICARGVPC